MNFIYLFIKNLLCLWISGTRDTNMAAIKRPPKRCSRLSLPSTRLGQAWWRLRRIWRDFAIPRKIIQMFTMCKRREDRGSLWSLQYEFYQKYNLEDKKRVLREGNYETIPDGDNVLLLLYHEWGATSETKHGECLQSSGYEVWSQDDCCKYFKHLLKLSH